MNIGYHRASLWIGLNLDIGLNLYIQAMLKLPIYFLRTRTRKGQANEGIMFCSKLGRALGEDGNVAILSAIIAPTLILLAFGGLQVKNAVALQGESQGALDSAVLAVVLEMGAGATQNEARAAGNIAFAANIKAGGEGLDPTIAPTYSISVNGDDVRVDGKYTSPIDFPLSGILGLPSHQISVGSSSFVSVPRDEVTLVLDVSISMQGTPFDAMKVAASDFIQTIAPFEPTGNAYRLVSLVPFANRVNLGPEHVTILAPETPEFPNSLYAGCVRPESFDEQASDSDLNFNNLRPFAQHFDPVSNIPFCPGQNSRVVLASGNETELLDHIDKLELSLGTATDHALSWGWRTLSPEWRFRLDMLTGFPRPYVPRNSKTLILLTDGRVTGQNYVPDGAGGEVLMPRDNADGVAAFLKVCEEIEAQGTITVYTVGFNLSATDTVVRDALIDCATPDGQYFDSSVATVSGVFGVIAADINSARLIE